MAKPDSSPPVPKYGTFTTRMLASTLDISLVFMIALPFVDMLVNYVFAPLDTNVFTNVIAKMNLPFDSAHAMDSLVKVIHSPAFWHAFFQQHVIERVLVDNLLQVGCVAIYVLPFWYRYSTTPGKMLFRLQIRDVKTGERMTDKQALVRFLAYLVSAIPFSLGFIWILLNKKRRGWHDYIAGTVVVVAPKTLSA